MHACVCVLYLKTDLDIIPPESERDQGRKRAEEKRDRPTTRECDKVSEKEERVGGGGGWRGGDGGKGVGQRV